MNCDFTRHRPPKLFVLTSFPAIDKAGHDHVAVPVSGDEFAETWRLKLSNVITDLKINDVNISSYLKHRRLGIFDRCLGAFAADDNEWAISNLVNMKTILAMLPLFEKSCALPFHR